MILSAFLQLIPHFHEMQKKEPAFYDKAFPHMPHPVQPPPRAVHDSHGRQAPEIPAFPAMNKVPSADIQSLRHPIHL